MLGSVRLWHRVQGAWLRWHAERGGRRLQRLYYLLILPSRLHLREQVGLDWLALQFQLASEYIGRNEEFNNEDRHWVVLPPRASGQILLVAL